MSKQAFFSRQIHAQPQAGKPGQRGNGHAASLEASPPVDFQGSRDMRNVSGAAADPWILVVFED